MREARAEALVDEMDRSLSLLDNFMSNALHFVRTPCNVMTQALDAARGQLDSVVHAHHSNSVVSAVVETAILESKLMLDVTVGQLSDLIRTLDDVSDLQRFEQGAELRPVISDVELLPLCHSVMAECVLRCHDGVTCVLDIGGATHTMKLKNTKECIVTTDEMYRTRPPSLIAVLLSNSHRANTTRGGRSGASDRSEAAASRATPPAEERNGEAGDCLSV